MEKNIIFIPSKNNFSTEEKERISNIVEESLDLGGNLLCFSGQVTVTIYPFSEINYGKPWVGGFARAKDWLELTIPPGLWLEKDLKGTSLHELHHSVRGHVGLKENKKRGSLFDAVISEGLAIAFEVENVQDYTPPHSLYNEYFIKRWLPKFLEEKDSKVYSYQAWFVRNRRTRGIAYRLGKSLVDAIEDNNPDLNSASLVRASPKKLWRLLENII